MIELLAHTHRYHIRGGYIYCCLCHWSRNFTRKEFQDMKNRQRRK